jgi:DNA-binding transcriptional LysR family regulator
MQYAVTLAEELNFGRAAAREHVTQSAFSQHIQRLERELGVRLFDRSTHHVRLTEPGRLFVEESRRLLADVDDVVTRTRRAATAGAPTQARLGCVGYAQRWPEVRALLHAYADQRPDLPLETSYGPVNDLLRALRDGRLDAVVVNGHVADDTLTSVSVAAVPLELVLPRTHRLAARSAVAVGELGGERLVLWPRELNPVVYDDMLRFFERHEVPVTVAEVTQVGQAWLWAVAEGGGIALAAVVNPLQHDAVVRRPFAADGPVLDLRLAWRRNEKTSAVRALVDVVRRSRAVPREGGTALSEVS